MSLSIFLVTHTASYWALVLVIDGADHAGYRSCNGVPVDERWAQARGVYDLGLTTLVGLDVW